MLKALEEPPPNTRWLLVTAQPERLLPTIRSRALKIALPRPDREAASTWLRAQGVDPEAPAGDDRVTVRVTDARGGCRALDVTVPIAIEDRPAPATPCDLAAFDVEAGCCDGRPGPGTAPLAAAVLALVRRRRRA